MMFPVVIQNMEWWLAGCAKGQMKVKRELTFVLCVCGCGGRCGQYLPTCRVTLFELLLLYLV